MILYYLVSFKGHKCALVVNPAITAGWLLRCRKGDEPHKFLPPPNEPGYIHEAVARAWAITQTRQEIFRAIVRTESSRVDLRGTIVSEIPLIARLLADQPDTRKRARRWRIVPVHRGPKGKQQ